MRHDHRSKLAKCAPNAGSMCPTAIEGLMTRKYYLYMDKSQSYALLCILKYTMVRV